MNNNICLFCSYSTEKVIPLYVKDYLKNLRPYFIEFILVTNERDLAEEEKDFCKLNNIKLQMVQNEGHDFGMYYKVMQKLNLCNYDELALVNDSCLLVGDLKPFFKWAERSQADLISMTDSYAILPHHQSYFLMYRKKAIKEVQKYFDFIGLCNSREMVIHFYEIGLSQYLLNKGFKADAYYPASQFQGCKKSEDLTLFQADKLLRHGFPLLKKTMFNFTIAHSRRKNWHYKKFQKLVLKNKGQEYLDSVFKGKK